LLNLKLKLSGPKVPFALWIAPESEDYGAQAPIMSEPGGSAMLEVLRKVWRDDEGQDIAEYAVMLAVILVIVVGTVRLIGSQANNVFSETASAIGS
jgi:Flp pilus assembly pilin Flp